MPLCPVFLAEDPSVLRWLDRRPTVDPQVTERVAEILRQVERGGTDAVLALVRELDAPSLQDLLVDANEIQSAHLSDADQAAIEKAASNIETFHDEQLAVITEGWTSLGEGARDGWAWRMNLSEEEPLPTGILELASQVAKGIGPSRSGAVGQRLIPVDSAGVYAPGGKASYPSSVLMNALPARSAGVDRVVLATPPAKDGAIPSSLLATARRCGIETILKAGGAVAVAAFAFGIEGLPRVDVVVGPGNAYVNEAKRLLWGTVGADSYAASSEVAVIAFDDCPPEYAAADWLTQVEHSEDNVGVLFTSSHEMAERVLAAVEEQLFRAPNENRMRAALRDFGCVIVCPNENHLFDLVNRMAPEHLSVLTEEPGRFLKQIRNAGCLVLGLQSPQSAGDFVAGPSHTLPTAGAARFASPLNVMHFLRFQSVIRMEKHDLEQLAGTVHRFGEMEGFPAHASGFTVRGFGPDNSENGE
ncbi:MAG: histidinol dehydrogenase [Fimbriimonadaceae bacterium]|nr:histidinol dehydrogenase [Fimbriimonadaceae bacterium]